MIVLQITGVIILALIIAAMVAPNEALTWWQHNSLDITQSLDGDHPPVFTWPQLSEAMSGAVVSDDLALAEEERNVTPKLVLNQKETDHYLVYLSGIGTSGPDQLPVLEVPMVNSLIERLGDTTVVWDVYPYSVENQALTRGRRLSGVWRKLRGWKYDKKPGRFLASLINIRNAFQMLVSSDRRYGPVFNMAVAQQIAAALLRHGYVPEHKKPVTLLGWSGGAQIAVGATWYLASLGMPVRVMSMAGIMSADPGIDRATKIWHLSGRKDHVQAFGKVLFVRRWRIFRKSSWNRGLRDGRIEMVDLGELTHVGKTGYYSAKVALADGRYPCQATLDKIVEVLVKAGLASDNASKPGYKA